MVAAGDEKATCTIFAGPNGAGKTGFVEKGLRPLQPSCSGSFPHRASHGSLPLSSSPPCHHCGQGCRSFLPKICAPLYIIPSSAVCMSARSELESERYKEPCVARKTYALDTAWWRENSRVKLAKTTSYIQYRLIQQSWQNHLCLVPALQLNAGIKR